MYTIIIKVSHSLDSALKSITKPKEGKRCTIHRGGIILLRHIAFWG